MKRVGVFGASGGIGAALVEALAARNDIAEIHAGSRHGPVPTGPKVRPFRFDAMDDATITPIAAPLDMVWIATGILPRADGIGPEKSLRQLDAAGLAELYTANTIVPALILKAIQPLLPKDRRASIGVLSARVGSIGDNRLGGWHAYRASKAALNMLVRTIAVEWSRTHPHAVLAALHPGTVATPLSAPFQKGVPADRLFTPDFSARSLLGVLESLQPADSGNLYAWDGAPIPF